MYLRSIFLRCDLLCSMFLARYVAALASCPQTDLANRYPRLEFSVPKLYSELFEPLVVAADARHDASVLPRVGGDENVAVGYSCPITNLLRLQS